MEDLINKLKKLADKYGMVDVGRGAVQMLGVGQSKLDSALLSLEKVGYFTYGGQIQQPLPAGSVKRIVAIKVLCKPGVDRKDIFTDEVYHLA